MRYTIHNGDALETMRGMEAASFDAVLCDPPYGLNFMGKAWDHGVPGMEVWAEALRVLKPGAFLLAFGGTRTFHRLACAIEDAGFEIRDCVAYVNSQGMPKGPASLKPSWEPIIMATKAGPHHLSIDESRIPVSPDDTIHAKNPHTKGGFGHGRARVFGNSSGAPVYSPSKGRYPANLLCDEHLTEGWARYFYAAKASRSEREAGTNGNAHPCVKPLDLNRYLASLILPPKRDTPRRILVPFSGSGSEMIGALLAGWDEAVGIEREADYCATSLSRLDYWTHLTTRALKEDRDAE